MRWGHVVNAALHFVSMGMRLRQTATASASALWIASVGIAPMPTGRGVLL